MTTTIRPAHRILISLLALVILITASPIRAEAQVSGGAYVHQVSCAYATGKGALFTGYLTGVQPGAVIAVGIKRWDPRRPDLGWVSIDAAAEVNGYQPWHVSLFDGKGWKYEAMTGSSFKPWYRNLIAVGVNDSLSLGGTSGYQLLPGYYYALSMYLWEPGMTTWKNYTPYLNHVAGTTGTKGYGSYCYVG